MATDGIKIGPVAVAGRVALGPLAGYTDYPFRAAVARFGCPYAVTPLVAAEGVVRKNAATLALLATGPDDCPVVAAQIFGARPRVMAEAARRVAGAGFPLVDINLGCPARRVRSQAAGSALLEDMTALRAVVRAVVAASPVPVTAKMRVPVAPARAAAVAVMLVEEGISALAVHGRTTQQGFAGPVNASAIAEVAAAVAVPVWANGGVYDGPSAADLLARTRAAGVMVGRASRGRPYLVGHIETHLAAGEQPPPPSAREIADIIWYHFERAAAAEEEGRAARRFRAHLLHYLKYFPGARVLRARAAQVANGADVRAVAAELVRLSEDGP